ncbi:MAG TPA: GNAT family N-acetyltransferase [Ktedonobacterales bacterium]|nr:GNAT family N-acetyltransferase [Ktedonobacterales bacterium]
MPPQHTIQTIQITSAADTADSARFCAVPDGTPLDSETLAATGADEHWLLTDAAGAVARCSLWWSTAPTYQQHRVGLIGHYAADDDTLAETLLRHACDRLRQAGCTIAIGPMDGSTYNRYRLVTEPGADPPFFLEPTNPASWPAHFTGNGFAPLAEYYSAVQDHLEATDPRIPDIERRMSAAGVHVRPLDPAAFERDLRGVYPVVAAGFAESLLASPIDEEAFVAQYRPLESLLVPELAQIAETDERAVGFLLVVPDWLQAQRGELIDTGIAKTTAVLPDYQRQGLSILLAARAIAAGRALGYTRAIHALIREDNVSRRLSDVYHGRVIRRYTLYAKELGNAS